MLDVVLGGLLVVLGIRGWMRGLVKEVISLAVLVIGTVAAFRLSTPLGRVFADMSGASPDASRYVAGIVIFFVIAIAAAIVSRVLHLGMRILPGVSTVNRLAGAGLSLLTFALVVTIVVSMATVVELPEAAADELDNSSVAAAIVDPDGLPQRTLGLLSGDRIVEISLRIQELTGRQRAVAMPNDPIELEATPVAELERLPDAEETIFSLLNRERVAADVEPLQRSSGLNQVAYDRAVGGYNDGLVGVLSDEELRLELNEEGMPSTKRAEFVVLATSPEGAHEALTSRVEESMTNATFSRVGVAVIRGPVGLLIVEVLSG